MVNPPGAEHLPCRPSWDCLACGQSWPCAPAREHLASTHTRTWLAIYAAAQMQDATVDLPTATPAQLYERFLSWTRTP